MTLFKSILVFISIFLAFNTVAQPVIEYGNNKDAGRFVKLNGVSLYFEEYGKGDPLVLIHGNGGNIAYVAPQIEYFSNKYRVIVIDSRGRGKSELGKDSLTYQQMADDLNALLDFLHVDSTYIIGRSDGAIVGLLMGIYYPVKTNKIAAFAGNVTPDAAGLFADGYAEVVRDRKHADEMLAKHDTTDNWHLVQQRNRMMELQPHITSFDLKKVKCPVLVLSCDRDDIPLQHTLEIYRGIRKANLCIFPQETHRVTKENPPLFNATVDKYFSQPFEAENWKR